MTSGHLGKGTSDEGSTRVHGVKGFIVQPVVAMVVEVTDVL